MGEKHQYMVAFHVAHTRGSGPQPRHMPDWELNQPPFGSRPALNPLNYTILVEFGVVFFLKLFSSFSLLWLEKCLDMISISLNFLRLVLCSIMWSMFDVHLNVCAFECAKECILCFFGMKGFIYI